MGGDLFLEMYTYVTLFGDWNSLVFDCDCFGYIPLGISFC